jgi:hypothetical protein
VESRFYAAEQEPRAAIVLGHGAGAGHTHPFMTAVAGGLARRGIHAVTFNFPYVEAGRRTPDPGAVLEEAFADAIREAQARPELRGVLLFAGGKSMGGRIASQASARGLLDGIAGLVFLGYPLHPPGKPQQLRDRHLAKVPVPMLFVQGSRDAFGTPDELRPVLDRLGDRATLIVIDDGDHSFAVRKSFGRSQDDVMERILDDIGAWISDTSAH